MSPDPPVEPIAPSLDASSSIRARSVFTRPRTLPRVPWLPPPDPRVVPRRGDRGDWILLVIAAACLVAQLVLWMRG